MCASRGLARTHHLLRFQTNRLREEAVPDLSDQKVGPNGPEAGVWVIAKSQGLADQAREDRGDIQGRHLMPDLASANYEVWVRGYGPVDPPKVISTPGKLLNLTAVPGLERSRGG